MKYWEGIKILGEMASLNQVKFLMEESTME